MTWQTQQEKQAKVVVRGEEQLIDPKDVTASHLLSVAKNAGLQSFFVRVNNVDIETPSDFPEIRDGDVVEILPYDEWGSLTR